MIAFRPIVSLLGAGVLLAALAGCDEHAVETDGAREVVFDLRPLFRIAEGERCVSVVDSLVLRVTEADGSEQTTGRALTPDEAEVRIPVEVEPGAVTFAAEVRSNNGTRLYAGSASAEVEAGGFSVEVPLAAVNAVLKACPDVVPLVLSDNAYRGELRVINRGSRATAWEAAFDPPLCDGEPCFHLDPSAAPIAAGDTVRVVGTALARTLTDAFDVQIFSEVGALDVRFVVQRRRVSVAPPDTADS